MLNFFPQILSKRRFNKHPYGWMKGAFLGPFFYVNKRFKILWKGKDILMKVENFIDLLF